MHAMLLLLQELVVDMEARLAIFQEGPCEKRYSYMLTVYQLDT